LPLYTFHNKITGETKDIVMSMNDEHRYIDDSGYEWERVWYSPAANTDTVVDPNSANSFKDVTKKKKGNLGNLFDYSRELSEKRAKIYDGVDPLRTKAISEHKKLRKGRLLGEEVRTNREKTFEF
jgi:ABC-type Zn2+ transport system substrate-binding protein/surface adhesin